MRSVWGRFDQHTAAALCCLSNQWPNFSWVVAVDASLPPQHRRQLEALYPHSEMLDGLSASHLHQAHVVFLVHGQLDPVDALNLRWVQFRSAGFGLIGTALESSSVAGASGCGVYSTTVAEMVLWLLLSLYENCRLVGNVKSAVFGRTAVT